MTSPTSQDAIWFAAGALLSGPEPEEGVCALDLLARNRWRACLSACSCPITITAILARAFPEPHKLDRQDLCDLAAALLDKA